MPDDEVLDVTEAPEEAPDKDESDIEEDAVAPPELEEVVEPKNDPVGE